MRAPGQRRNRFVIATLVAIWVAACGGEGASAKERLFPEDPDLRWDRIGLFIAINEYKHADGVLRDLRGCVNDMKALRKVFREDYAFERTAWLQDEDATQAGIRSALKQLIAETRKARARLDAAGSKKQLYVVVGYAGHGRQVLDRDRDDQKDESHQDNPSMDESWAPHDAGRRKAQSDVLDDDLKLVWRELERQGAKVLVISDSCHSGTIHRGEEPSQKDVPRTIPRGDDEPAPVGPEKALFAGDPELQSMKLDKEAQVVLFAACLDAERAWETEGRGRLSLVLQSVLTGGKLRTYGEIRQAVRAEFKRKGWENQTPQFRIAGLESAPFLGEERLPSMVGVRTTEQKGAHVWVERGSLHGLAPGSRLTLYENSLALRKRARPWCTAKVVECGPFASRIRLSREDELPATTRARFDGKRFPEIQVRAPSSATLVGALVKEGRLRSAAGTTDAHVHVRHDPQKGYEFLLPESPGVPVPFENRTDDALLRSRLLFLAARQTLARYDENKHLLGVRYEVDGGDASQRPEPRFPHGSRVQFTLLNRGRRPLHVAVFLFRTPDTASREVKGKRTVVEFLYPPSAALPHRIPGRARTGAPGELAFPGRLRMRTPAAPGAKGEADRYVLKIVASAQPLDVAALKELAQPPGELNLGSSRAPEWEAAEEDRAGHTFVFWVRRPEK